MATGAIQSTTDTSAVPNRFAALSSDQFIKVLVTELTNQDPFQPQDSSKILEQLSSLRNIESQMVLQEKLGDLVTASNSGQSKLLESLQTLIMQNQLSAGGGLIGKMVRGVTTGSDGAPQTVSGLVTGVRVLDGKVLLDLDTGQALPMDNVTFVANGEQSEAVLTQSSPQRLDEDTITAQES